MKLRLLILILALSIRAGFSQDWQLFIDGQNSYYKQQFENTTIVENFLLDSSSYSNGAKFLYFNAQTELKEDCQKEVLNALSDMYYYKNPSKIDSLLEVGDSLLYFSQTNSGIDTLIIKPLCKLNESWMSNGIRFTCSQLGVRDIFGIEDSIKIFSCEANTYDTIELILLKKHGLLQFLPFNEFIAPSIGTELSPYFELIGFTNSEVSRGYIQPGFSEYFHLNAGDKLVWHIYSAPEDYQSPASSTYRADSVTYAYVSPDSVYYTFSYKNFNESGKKTNTGIYSSTHLKKDEGKILSNHISWFGLKYDLYTATHIFILNSLRIENEGNDTITYAEYELSGLSLDTADCNLDIIADYGRTTAYSTREGLIFQATYSWGESSSTMTGSVINGIVYGDTIIPTSVDKNVYHDLHVYPNPVSDFLNIEFPDQNMLQIQIFNLQGCIVTSESFSERINVSALKAGMYILKIRDDDKTVWQGKIVKR